MKLPIALILLMQTALYAAGLQLLLDLTPEGGTLTPPPGVYTGRLEIRHAIVLDGMNQVTLDGDSSGTVISVLADNAVIQNVRIVRSGRSHDKVDAGILVSGDNIRIENCTIQDCLFGIHLSAANNCRITGNSIDGLDLDGSLRGDGIRLWNGTLNQFSQNRVTGARDVVFTNAPDNHFTGNRVEQCRMGIELIFSPGCVIEGNEFTENEHGIVGIYSNELVIQENTIKHQDKRRGSAIAVKGSSETSILKNVLMDCAIGITANAPIFPEDVLYVRENLFAYNDAAIYLYGDRGGHEFLANQFKGNFSDVVVSHPDASNQNRWEGNCWDSYQGFDQDGDGQGDSPYRLNLYSDRLWMDRDMIRFFRGSPLLSLIDLVDQLVMFSDPPLLLEDTSPAMRDRFPN